jgi:DNA-binding MarR family transcriptional regulator
MTQEKMSSVLYIDKAATARAIKSLEQKEYVIRIKDSNDKRINRVYLSEKAKKNIEEIRSRVFHWSEFLTEDLDPHITDVVYDALEAMVNKVEDKKEKYRKEEI